MISLLPYANPQNAIEHFVSLSSRATGIRGSASDPLAASADYLIWSIEAMRTLRTVLEPESVCALIETTSFRLIHAVDAGSYPRLALGSIVQAELDARILALDEAAGTLRKELSRWDWQGGLALQPTHYIGVLDTNVLMLQSEHLLARDWNTLVDARFGQRISLVIPQAVILELDRLKRSNGTMVVGGGGGGKKLQQRTLARRALRILNSAFPGKETVFTLRESRDDNNQVVSPLRLVIHLDDLRPQAFAEADAEIIDRALSLQPWAQKVTLLTDDTSMRFRAEHAGLRARQSDWGEDEESGGLM